jgi:hypothetical protein
VFSVRYELRLEKQLSIKKMIQPDGSPVIDEIHVWFSVRTKKHLMEYAVGYPVNTVASHHMAAMWFILIYDRLTSFEGLCVTIPPTRRRVLVTISAYCGVVAAPIHCNTWVATSARACITQELPSYSTFWNVV